MSGSTECNVTIRIARSWIFGAFDYQATARKPRCYLAPHTPALTRFSYSSSYSFFVLALSAAALVIVLAAPHDESRVRVRVRKTSTRRSTKRGERSGGEQLACRAARNATQQSEWRGREYLEPSTAKQPHASPAVTWHPTLLLLLVFRTRARFSYSCSFFVLVLVFRTRTRTRDRSSYSHSHSAQRYS
jgi:hypothetical protein